MCLDRCHTWFVVALAIDSEVFELLRFLFGYLSKTETDTKVSSTITFLFAMLVVDQIKIKVGVNIVGIITISTEAHAMNKRK